MEKWIIKKFSQRKIATKERKTETMTGIRQSTSHHC